MQVIPIAARFGALGDTIMFLPALEVLARRFGHKVDVITSGGWSKDILDHSPHIAECLVLAGTRRRPLWLSRSKQQGVAMLKKRSGQPVFVFEPSNKIPDLLGKAEIDASQWQIISSELMHWTNHVVDRGCQFAATAFSDAYPSVELSIEKIVPRLDRSLLHQDDLQQWLEKHGLVDRPLVLVQPGNKRTMSWRPSDRSSNHKYWPPERWAKLIDRCSEQVPEATFVICGVPAEQKIAQTISSLAKAKTLAAADDLPLTRLMALCDRALAMISVDTGPAHLAGALDCPMLVMFAGTDVRKFGPRTNGPIETVCAYPEDASPNAGGFHPDYRMLDLEVDSVVAGWERLSSQLNLQTA